MKFEVFKLFFGFFFGFFGFFFGFFRFFRFFGFFFHFFFRFKVVFSVKVGVCPSLYFNPRINSVTQIHPDNHATHSEVIGSPLAAYRLLNPEKPKLVHFFTYGCQMNVNDSDLVYGILQNYGYEKTENAEVADVRLIMTCSVRDKPERVVWAHLQKIKHENGKKAEKNMKNSDFDSKTSQQKQLVGVLGCMAERVRDNFGDLADIIAGPDSYRSLPFLLADIEAGNKLAFNVELSNDETYRVVFLKWRIFG